MRKERFSKISQKNQNNSVSPSHNNQIDDEILESEPGWLQDAAEAPTLLFAQSLSLEEKSLFLVGREESQTKIDSNSFSLSDQNSKSRYHVKEELARGGLGKILRAYDRRLLRPVALKRLLSFQKDENTKRNEERFVREALLTARLEHPGIVPIHDLGFSGEQIPYYAMKLVDGRSFDQVCREKTTLSERLSLLPHVIDVAEAVAYAHSQHIVHRDLKPQNILVGFFGETIVIDWGLAKDLRTGFSEKEIPPSSQEDIVSESEKNLTVTGAILGTPAYMPPEQARGEPASERADVYALGAILYELLCGKAPYQGKSQQKVLLQLLETPPIPLVEEEPKVPQDLLAIVEKSMQRDPAQRYENAKEFAEDLRRFQTGKIVEAYEYSITDLAFRILQKYRSIVIAMGVFLLVLASVVVWYNYQNLKERQRAVIAETQAKVERDKAQVAEAKQRKIAMDQKLSLARKTLDENPAEVLAHLKELVQDYPEFQEWGVLRTLAQDALARGVPRVFHAHEGSILWGTFSPDGKLYATASRDHTVRLWNIKSGTSQVLRGHKELVRYVVFSPDGTLLASTSNDHTVKLWNTRTGKEHYTFTGHKHNTHLASFSPDGSILATSSHDRSIRLWSTKTGKELAILEGHTSDTSWLRFAHDASFLVSASDDNSIRIWNIDQNDPAQSTVKLVLTGHEDFVNHIKLSPDGKYIASGSNDTTLRLWDILTGKQLFVVRDHKDPVYDLAFSPDGKMIASAGLKGTVLLSDAKTGEQIQTISLAKGQIRRLAFSPDGTFLAFAGSDKNVYLYDLLREINWTLKGHTLSVARVGFSPNGKTLASVSDDNTLRLWDISRITGETLYQPEKSFSEGGKYPVAISPNINQIVLRQNNGNLYLFDIMKQSAHLLGTHEGGVIGARFSEDGRLLASFGADKLIRVWEIEHSENTPKILHSTFIPNVDGVIPEDVILTVAFSPDGKMLASGNQDYQIRIWDLRTSEQITTLSGHSDYVYGLAFSPDGNTLASTSKDSLRLWDLPTQKGHILSQEKQYVGTSFSPDGETLVATGVFASIERWALMTETPSLFMNGIDGIGLYPVFSPTGQRLVVVGMKGVSLWDVATEEKRILQEASAFIYPKFSPDGKKIVLGGKWGKILLLLDDLPKEPTKLQMWLRSQEIEVKSNVSTEIK